MSRPKWKTCCLAFIAAVVVVFWLAALGSLIDRQFAPRAVPLAPLPEPLHLDATSVEGPSFIGVANCVTCHETEHRLWEPSHHAAAMRPATPQFVLGDFDNATFTHHGLASTFYRKGDDYFVRTEGRDGQPHDYRVSFTFGVTPLQQYLIEFPNGRLQCLPLCWDTRPKAEGGQRWFHIYDQERIAPDDPLFWTGPNQNWNFMCAECHSTNLRPRFDAAVDGYATSLSEINVSCEACHGPGEDHLAWARGKDPDADYDPLDAKGLVVQLKDLSDSTWVQDPETRKFSRSQPLPSRVELDTCARCHSRRGMLTEDYVYGKSIHNSHSVEPLTPAMYHADGQILDEVYVYGSFVQSLMYHKGVRCVDCHDAHSLKLKRDGNALCLNCHDASFSRVEHHFHPDPGAGTQCVDCHMSQRTYMVVDPRRDHSLRVPRPDLSLELGTPNACNDCHDDQTVQWSLDRVTEWYGPRQDATPHYGRAIHAGRVGLPDAHDLLLTLVADDERPAIARATALGLLRDHQTQTALRSAVENLTADDPMVRAEAVRFLELLPPADRWTVGAARLSDPVRLVRLEAVRVLAAGRAAQPESEATAAFDAALIESMRDHSINADRASSYARLGILHTNLGDIDAAIVAYEAAIRREPWSVVSYVNLTDIYRQRGREDDAQRLLTGGIQTIPEAAVLHYALGMSLVRQRDLGTALASLAQAAQLDPDNARYAYAYAVALDAAGQSDKAMAVLADAHERHPYDREILYALVVYHRERGELQQARHYAARLAAAWPNDPQAHALLDALQNAAPATP